MSQVSLPFFERLVYLSSITATIEDSFGSLCMGFWLFKGNAIANCRLKCLGNIFNIIEKLFIVETPSSVKRKRVRMTRQSDSSAIPTGEVG